MQRRERHMTDMDYKALRKGLGLQVLHVVAMFANRSGQNEQSS
jgi:hypothetical protein